MRIIAFDRFKPGVTMEQITPYLPDEVSNVWRLWKAGIVRENYARADEPGVVPVVVAAGDVCAGAAGGIGGDHDRGVVGAGRAEVHRRA